MKKLKKKKSLIPNASEMHEDLWAPYERKMKKKKRKGADQYSAEYLAETDSLQNRNPFDYH